MKAKELIEKLQNVDPETEVILWADHAQRNAPAWRTFDILMDEGDDGEIEVYDLGDVDFDSGDYANMQKGFLIEGG
jgi:hypothetical protein